MHTVKMLCKRIQCLFKGHIPYLSVQPFALFLRPRRACSSRRHNIKRRCSRRRWIALALGMCALVGVCFLAGRVREQGRKRSLDVLPALVSKEEPASEDPETPEAQSCTTSSRETHLDAESAAENSEFARVSAEQAPGSDQSETIDPQLEAYAKACVDADTSYKQTCSASCVATASALLRAYERAGAFTLKQSGYLDLMGKVWAMIVQKDDAVDLVFVRETEDLDSIVIQKQRLSAKEWQEDYLRFEGCADDDQGAARDNNS